MTQSRLAGNEAGPTHKNEFPLIRLSLYPFMTIAIQPQGQEVERTLMSSKQNGNLASIQELVYGIACLLVDDKASVRVEMGESDMGTVVGLRVADTDMGKIIGAKGRTARSIRTILSAASMKLGHHYSLDIQDRTGLVREDPEFS